MSYQYSTLNITNREIRLLILSPGISSSEAIQGHLRTCSLAENVPYEALSYTWGNPAPRSLIQLESCTFSVGSSLHIALTHLRHATETRTLWIDAICINQEDVQEREEQVGQMRDVYSSAKLVVIWLGEEYEDSDAAMHFLAILRKDFDLGTLGRESEFPAQKIAWTAVFALLKRPWWNRVWIIQEVAVGNSDPLVGCGSSWVPWSKFETLDQILGELEETGVEIVENLDNPISRLRMIRGGAQHPQQTVWRNMFLLLRATKDCQATDSRDKVYALLGLSSEEDRRGIRPDYTKPTVEVYTEVTKHIIQSEQSLDILECFKPSQLPGLPSWVPDFTASNWISHLQPHFQNKELNSKGASANPKPVVQFLEDSKIKVQGWLVDHVREISLESYDPEDPEKSLSSFENLARKALPAAITEETSQRLSETFWRCLLADRTLHNEQPAPKSYRELYSVFCGRSPVPENHATTGARDEKARRKSYLYPLISSMDSALSGRRFFITIEGRMGLGPLGTRGGDLIVVLKGAGLAFILRDNGIHGEYSLLREAYVSGLVFGEMFSEDVNKLLGKECQHFIIV